jgi:hypothetical protein
MRRLYHMTLEMPEIDSKGQSTPTLMVFDITRLRDPVIGQV